MDVDPVQKIRGHARELLESGVVEVIIGYERGSDGLTARPVFVRESSGVERLIFDETCTHNLAKYLLDKKDVKTAVVLKPCDSRATNLLLNEGQIEREMLSIIGVTCSGVVESGWHYKTDTLQARCQTCQLSQPLVYDFLVEHGIKEQPSEDLYSDVEEVEAQSISSRRAFWTEQFDRCVRCYACRQVCPACYCPECFAEQLEPLWVGIRIAPGENELWHTVRCMHVAGRCVGCNECERVCPVNIPLSLLNRKMEKEVRELFRFQPGLNAEEQPPFATFKKEEKLGFEE